METDPIYSKLYKSESTFFEFIICKIYIKKAINTTQRVYFVHEREKNSPLFSRALVEVRILNGEILRVSEDYISPIDEQKFEEDLKLNNEKNYCLYLLMKIYHFLEIVYGIRVLKMGADFLKDDLGIIWLLNISRLQYKQLEVALKDDAPIRQSDGLLMFEGKDGFAQEVEGRYRDVEMHETVKLLNNILKQHYENIRRVVKSDIPEAYYDEGITDELFIRLHPNAPFKLSELLRSSFTYEEIRAFVLKNARKLLYPNSNVNQGMSPELLAKFSGSSTTPKAVPGVIIKKSEKPMMNVSSVTKASPILNFAQRMKSSQKLNKKVESGSLSHRGVKETFGTNFTNTWWNLKPNIRYSSIFKQKLE